MAEIKCMFEECKSDVCDKNEGFVYGWKSTNIRTYKDRVVYYIHASLYLDKDGGMIFSWNERIHHSKRLYKEYATQEECEDAYEKLRLSDLKEQEEDFKRVVL